MGGGPVDIRGIPNVEGRAAAELDAENAISQKHADLGGAPGAAVGNLEHAGGFVFYRAYQNGRIYWKRFTGAHWVLGAILDRYLSLGGSSGFAGYPTTDETPTADGVGRFSEFQNATICWHPTSGAFEIHGDIRATWQRLGGAAWGYPVTNETPTRDGVGRFNHFRVGGNGEERSIHWHPNTGAHGVQGKIREHWSQLDWESSYLGYPTSSELDLEGVNAGKVNRFQRGLIVFRPGNTPLTEDIPDNVERKSELSTGGVRAAVRLVINSKGFYVYSGSFENDAAVSLSAAVSSVLEFQTPGGHVLAAGEERGLAGELTPGSESHTWTKGGHEPRIREHWDALKDVPMRTRLDTNIGVGNVIEFILVSLPFVVAAAFVIMLGSGSHKACPARPGPCFTDEFGQRHCDVEIPIVPNEESCR